jgi:hypothetical protein
MMMMIIEIRQPNAECVDPLACTMMMAQLRAWIVKGIDSIEMLIEFDSSFVVHFPSHPSVCTIVAMMKIRFSQTFSRFHGELTRG